MRATTFVLVAGLVLSFAGAQADDPPKGWEFVGQAQADTVEVRARVTGQLNRIAVREGDTVAKGDLLAELDPRPYKLALDAAQARVKVAEAKLQAAKIATAKRLLKNNVISPDEVALHEATEVEATAALMGAKAEAQQAELNLLYTRITAPIGGRVSRVRTSAGNLAIADQTHILTVVDPDSLYVSFGVPETILLQLRRDGKTDPGTLRVTVGFAGEDGNPHEAKLDSFASEVDPKTGTARFRATVPNPKGILVPGLSARIRLTPPSK